MKPLWKTIFVSALTLCLLSAVPGYALPFVKAKTTTEDGDPDMSELGEYNGIKHAIGCKDFENQAGWHGQWKIGSNLSIMLESALGASGRFVLVEREKLSAIIAEQDLATSGRTAGAKKVAQTGKLRPARYLATGAVTEVEDSQSGGGGGISIKGIRLGGGKANAQVTIIAKLVDTTTGEIVKQKRIVGKASRIKMDVGVNYKGIGTSLGGFEKTPLGQAAQDCINEAAKFFAKEMEEYPVEGAVVTVSKGKVIINRGSRYGVGVGQEFVMETEGEELIDPDTGEVLDTADGEIIGRLKVTKVSEKVAYCEVTDGEKNPEKGTRIIVP